MLPCVSSEIDHRCLQNVITKMWQTKQKPGASLMFLPHFDLLCSLLLKRYLYLLSIQNEPASLVAIHSKELWLSRKICPLSNLTQAFLLVEWILTGKKNRTYNVQILKMLDFWSVFVIRVALWTEKVECSLEYCRSWKIHSENFELWSTQETIWFTFWMKWALLMVEICVLCGWWLSNQYDIVLDTPL